MKDGEWAACQWRSTDVKAGGANILQCVSKNQSAREKSCQDLEVLLVMD